MCIACSVGSCLTCLGCRICSCCVGATIRLCGKEFKVSFSRLIYAALFIVCAVLAWILGIQIPEDKLREISSFRSCAKNDRSCLYDFFVERMLFGLTLFHAVHAVILIGVRRTTDPRVYIQEAFFPIRICALVGIIVGCLYIPVEFFEVYGYISMIGAFVFMLIQMVILIEFTYDIQKEWVSKMEDEQMDGERGSCFFFILAFVILLYLGGIAICIVLYVFFTNAQYDGACTKGGLNIFFITFNIIIAFVLSVLSVSSWVREKRPDAGLLQSSVFAVYCSYLVFSAIISEPTDWITGCNNVIYKKPVDDDGSRERNWTDTAVQIIGGIITICAVVWSTLRSSKVKSVCGFCSNDDDDDDDDEYAGEGDADLDEDTEVPYSYTYFHVVYMLGAMYVSQLLTNWRVVNKNDDSYNATDKGVTVDAGVAAVWIKMAASWIIAALYGWTLIAPIVCSNRDFS